MTDTTNTVPPLPKRNTDLRDSWQYTPSEMLAYGDARAAHAVAQMSKLEAGAILEYGVAVAAHAVAQIKGQLWRVSVHGTECELIDTYSNTVVARLCGSRARANAEKLAALLATAEQPAETREHILSAHIALSTCDGEGRVDKHHVQIAHKHIEAALRCLAATAHAPVAQAREITDAEIDALFPVGLNFEDSDWEKISHDELRSLVRAAIALANGRGGA